MSALEKIKKLLAKRIKKADGILAKIALLVKLVPSLQRQKEEDETALKLINALPQDFAEENAPRWYSLELANDKLLSSNFPSVHSIHPESERVFSTTSSGSISPYFAGASYLVEPYVFDQSEGSEWVREVISIMDEHSTRITQREYLPRRLDILNTDLGKTFEVALTSFEKCKNKIITVDQAAKHMRDVLQQAWGGLVELAKKKNTDARQNTNDLQLKKEGDRELVANILANDEFPKIRLVQLMSDMFNLHYKLSETRFGKNPLNTEFPLLKDYYSQWLAILDGVSGIVLKPYRPVEGT